MSQVSRDDVPPITVKTRMNQQSSDGTKPMIVFAEVSQNYRPVINADVLGYTGVRNWVCTYITTPGQWSS